MPFKVLIAEDDLPILALFTTIVERLGYQVTGLANGEAVLHHLQATIPDLILLDLTLEGATNGQEILDFIQENPQLDNTIIVIISANPKLSPEAFHHRVAKVITKPVRPTDIAQTVKMLLPPTP